MRVVKSVLPVCYAVVMLVMGEGGASAGDAIPLDSSASPCDISQALGIAKPECPALAPDRVSRGLQIGNSGPGQRPDFPSRSAAFQINFEFGSTQLTEEAARILDRIGTVLATPDVAGVKFRITGHTDGVGSASRNLKLSELRAEAVKAYLSSHFNISRERLEAVGKGSRELLNRSDPGASINRRVEITNLGG
jgi:outer membrane protein OmpA-like peptidoglycan-associated protein